MVNPQTPPPWEEGEDNIEEGEQRRSTETGESSDHASSGNEDEVAVGSSGTSATEDPSPDRSEIYFRDFNIEFMEDDDMPLSPFLVNVDDLLFGDEQASPQEGMVEIEAFEGEEVDDLNPLNLELDDNESDVDGFGLIILGSLTIPDSQLRDDFPRSSEETEAAVDVEAVLNDNNPENILGEVKREEDAEGENQDDIPHENENNVSMNDEDIILGEEINEENIPEKSEENIPEKSEENIPEKSEENIPENSEENIPENSEENIPEKSEENIPENSEENIPEKSEENIPENSEENIPENSEENIPENSEENIPENSEEKIPENSEENIPEKSEENIPEKIEENIAEKIVENVKIENNNEDKRENIQAENGVSIANENSEQIVENTTEMTIKLEETQTVITEHATMEFGSEDNASGVNISGLEVATITSTRKRRGSLSLLAELGDQDCLSCGRNSNWKYPHRKCDAWCEGKALRGRVVPFLTDDDLENLKK